MNEYAVRTYTPDNWVLLELKQNDGSLEYKVLAGWSGSYMYGSSWKISSGVTKIVEEESEYVIHNYTGSIYYCNKHSNEVSMQTFPILERIKDKVNDLVRVVEPMEAIEYLKGKL